MALTHGIKPIVTSGLVLCLDAGNRKSYPGIGTAWTDLSGRGNHGTLFNTPTYSSENGGSLTFNGSNQYVSNTMGQPLTSPFADLTNKFLVFDFWVNSNTSTPIGLYDTAPNLTNPLRNNPAGFVEWWNEDPKVSLGLSALTWTNITIEYSFTTNRTIKYYRNGNLISTTTGGTGPFVSWTTLNFGTVNQGQFWYSGKISIIKIYNRALSATEIAQNYNALKSRYI
jgi:hypothetical protein